MLCIPNRLLKSIAAEQTQSRGYISLANDHIVNELVTLDCTCNRLEEALRKRAHKLLSRISRVGGRKRECILEEESNVFVLHGETLSHSDLLDERDGAVEAAELYKSQMESLQETLDVLYDEMTRERIELELEVQGTQEKLAHFTTPLENQGKPIEQLGPRQAKRKLGEFKSRAQVALFFAESFGLQLRSLEVGTTSGKVISVPFGAASSSFQEPCALDDKEKVLQILYLLDKFGVGDKFYHELAAIDSALPRSYKVKKARVELNAKCDVQKIDGFDGAYRSLETALIQQVAALVSIRILNKKYMKYKLQFDTAAGQSRAVWPWRHCPSAVQWGWRKVLSQLQLCAHVVCYYES